MYLIRYLIFTNTNQSLTSGKIYRQSFSQSRMFFFNNFVLNSSDKLSRTLGALSFVLSNWSKRFVPFLFSQSVLWETDLLFLKRTFQGLLAYRSGTLIDYPQANHSWVFAIQLIYLKSFLSILDHWRSFFPSTWYFSTLLWTFSPLQSMF